jgi:hypothetical protein
VGATIGTTYFPSGTVHHCRPWLSAQNLWVNLTAKMAATGASVSCSISAGVTIEAWFGGMAVRPTDGYTFPDFFPSDSTQEAGNSLIVNGQTVTLSANLTFSNSAGQVQTVVNTSVWRLFDDLESPVVVIQDAAMGVSHRAKAVWTGPKTMRMCLGTAACNVTPSTDGLLDRIFIRTPVPLIDTALYAAISGLENTYETGKAWLEGLQGWKSYWCNNYQVDAALHLGGLWEQRARDAIVFFAQRPGGLGSIYTASGDKADPRPAGLPYFLLTLHRYWRATGDTALVDDVMVKCGGFQVLEQLLVGLDPDDDQLLGFWSGGNEFLYQSDHLNLPGAALSPTLFMAGVLEGLAEMMPNHTSTVNFKRRAVYMASEVTRLLWLPDKGRFASLRDFQNHTQTARVLYFTDLCYPTLYAGSLLPLNATYHTLLSVNASDLWMPADASCPYPRLRVGNMLPTLFGNNVPSVVAMSEMSEALLQGQVIDQGVSLLEGVSATASSRSNAPGNVMEFVSLSGRGSGDGQFGNPQGALVLAVVRGLFGLSPGSGESVGKALGWRPAIPESWAYATLELSSGIRMNITGEASSRSYCLTLPVAQHVRIRVPLYRRHVKAVVDGVTGQELAHDILEHPGGGQVELAVVTDHIHVVVSLHPVAASAPPEASNGVAARLAVNDDDRTVVRQTSSALQRQPVDIFSSLNTNWTRLMNFWNPGHFAGFKFDGALVGGPHGEALRNFSMLPAQNGTPWFLVSANDTKNSVCLTLGDYGEVQAISRGVQTVSIVLGKPDPRCVESVSFDVGASASALEFLWAAEPRPRLTGETIGTISITLDPPEGDATTPAPVEVPLIVGQNIDSMVQPYASELLTRRVNVSWVNGPARQPDGTPGAAANTLFCAAFTWTLPHPARVKSVTIAVFRADVMLNVFAVNALQGAGPSAIPSSTAAVGCQLPLPQSTPFPAHELVATTFTKIDGEVWRDWDWSSITTVIDVYRFTNLTALACTAHGHGARVLLNLGDKELLDWGFNRTRDLDNRSRYDLVATQVTATGADGISLDIESNVAADPAQQAAARLQLTLFTKRLRTAMKRSNPASVLIFCTTGYPNRPDANKGSWPHFDLAALANNTDWFFVMAYGTDEWRDNRSAVSNSNIDFTKSLIAGYPQIGVPLSHLVLGLPWYGYDNTCEATTAPDARVCIRGKSGKELGADGFYQEIPLMYDLRHKDACSPPVRKCGPESFDPAKHTVLGLLQARSSPIMFDEHAQSPFFNYVDRHGTTHQVWYDNAQTLSVRYSIARQAGLRGVGSWRSDDVAYDTAAEVRCSRGLWAAMSAGEAPRWQSAACPLGGPPAPAGGT